MHKKNSEGIVIIYFRTRVGNLDPACTLATTNAVYHVVCIIIYNTILKSYRQFMGANFLE